jgi:hypothetical protein
MPMVEPSIAGVRVCIKCCWLFISLDVARLRICADCKHGDDNYEPKSASTRGLSDAVKPLRPE